MHWETTRHACLFNGMRANTPYCHRNPDSVCIWWHKASTIPPQLVLESSKAFMRHHLCCLHSHMPISHCASQLVMFLLHEIIRGSRNLATHFENNIWKVDYFHQPYVIYGLWKKVTRHFNGTWTVVQLSFEQKSLGGGSDRRGRKNRYQNIK